jgi:N-methylhydantoinase B
MKGGVGKRIVFKVPDDEYAPIPPVNLAMQSGRYVYPPQGLFGGKSGARAEFLVNGVPGNPYGLTQLKPGDVVTIDAPGGGGYGRPLERDPEMVEADVLEGYVTIEKAENEYGVCIDRTTMKVDRKTTAKLRRKLQKGS